MLKNYPIKPGDVMACEIAEDGTLTDLEGGVWKYRHKGRGPATTILEFTIGAKQAAPKVGDFIIRLSKTDIYLCGRAVFLKKYVVERMRIR